jgi:hypothetical protein
MAMTEHFVQIHVRHMRILARLIEQSKLDMFGSIGWKALIEGDDDWTMDELFLPLLQRGLIEDLTAVPDLGPKAGKYFVRITPLGAFCHSVGFMLKDRHKGTEKEMQKYADELQSLTSTSEPPTSTGENYVEGTA